MAFDLMSGAGLGNQADDLRQQLTDLFTRAITRQHMQQEQQRIALEQQRIEGDNQLRAAQLKSMDAARQSEAGLRDQQAADRVAMMTPKGAVLSPAVKGILDKGGLPLYEHQDSALPSVAMQGAAQLTGKAPRITGLAGTRNAGHPEQDVFSGTAQQAQAEQARQDKIAAIAQARQDKLDATAQAQQDRQDNLRLAASLRPAPQAPLQLITTTDANGNQIQKFVAKQAGETYAKPAGETLNNRLESAKAVKQTGDDIIAQLSDPAFKAVVGPALGRAASLRDFIGNPPPEFSKLAGQIESYALANMGVHGMRSAQGAQQIAHLLDQHHSAESLIAAIQGLNGFSQHFLENNGKTTVVPSTGSAPANETPEQRIRRLLGGK